eukprot:s906_g16.t1
MLDVQSALRNSTPLCPASPEMLFDRYFEGPAKSRQRLRHYGLVQLLEAMIAENRSCLTRMSRRHANHQSADFVIRGTFHKELVARSSGQPQEFDPSCEQYFYDGIDWGDLRQTFEIYADKYLDRPQLLAKDSTAEQFTSRSYSSEFALAQRYAFSYHPENRCQLGDLSLRFFLWLSVDPAELADVARAQGRRGDETLDWFWDLNVSWAEVHGSGWPLFSIMAAVSEKLRDDGQEICTTEAQLAPFIDSFDNAIMVPAERCAALLLEAPQCPDMVASALLALADVMRTTAWQQSNRYYQFTSEMPRSQPPERDAERLLQQAEAMVRSQSARWSWLTTRWPVWRLLDRLGAAEAVNVSSGGSWFWMYVFPHRVRSDGIISNRIRATSKAYCLQLFQDEVRRLLEQMPRPGRAHAA